MVIKFIPISQVGSVFKDYEREIRLTAAGGTLAPHTNYFGYKTFTAATLTKDDIDKLNSTKATLCAIGKVRWADDTGKYQTDFGRCLMAEPEALGFNWHVVQENNREHKL